MTERRDANIVIEKINLERIRDIYDAATESREEIFAQGFLAKTDFSIEEVESWIKGAIEDWENEKGYDFFILDMTTKSVVGWIFFTPINHAHKFANLGCWVRTSHTGKGIATEAVKLTAQYGFEKLGLQRIEIVVAKDNLPSLKVAEKAGATREGLLRNRTNLHGTPCDSYMYSLIPTDYAINKTT
jgi:ribosomal-protein-serine acetyltransferase